MNPAARSWSIIAPAAIVVVTLAAFTLGSGGDSAVEIAGDETPVTTAGVPDTTAPGLPALDWNSLLGGSDDPAPRSTAPAGIADSPPWAGSLVAPPTPVGPDPTGSAPGTATAGGTPTTLVRSASAGPTTSSTVAPATSPAGATTTTVVATNATTSVASSTTSTSTTSTTSTTSVVATTATTSTTTTATTTTTTTTTTTEAPPPTEPSLAPFTRTFDSSGGSITVSWNGSALSLDSIDPERRHRALVLAASATTVSVRFFGRDDDSQITVQVNGNELSVTIT